MKNFQDIAEQQGWTLAQQVELLLTYIEQQDSHEAFENFIAEIDVKPIIDYDKFQSLWVKQECINDDFCAQIQECYDFQEVFQVISLWSKRPLIDRVNTFLERNNNAVLDEEGRMELETYNKPMQCVNCDFEFIEASTCMEEGVGKTLVEVPCCPNCRSTNINRIGKL